MPQNLFHPLAAALITAAGVAAQALVHVPDAKLLDRPVNMIPFGSHEGAGTYQTQRYQTLIPSELLGTTRRAIREIGFAPQTSGRHIFDRITVRMTQTKMSDLGTDFAANLGNRAVTTLVARDYHWHHDVGQWSSIGLERAFLFDPTAGHLVIDIVVRNARSTGGLPEAGFYRAEDLQRVYAITSATGALPSTGIVSTGGLLVQIAFDLAATGAFGDGCVGSNGKKPAHSFRGAPELGAAVQAELTDALSGMPAMMLLGATIDATFFPMPLPGAGECRIYTLPLTVTPLITATGTTILPLRIPKDLGLRGVRFYTQFLTLDLAANKTGLTTSNFTRVLIGSGSK